MTHKIHYIGNDQKAKFIIAKTNCGKHWQDIEEFTAIVSDVTCSKCKNLITTKQN
jgi:hypothetical protein